MTCSAPSRVADATPPLLPLLSAAWPHLPLVSTFSCFNYVCLVCTQPGLKFLLLLALYSAFVPLFLPLFLLHISPFFLSFFALPLFGNAFRLLNIFCPNNFRAAARVFPTRHQLPLQSPLQPRLLLSLCHLPFSISVLPSSLCLFKQLKCLSIAVSLK